MVVLVSEDGGGDDDDDDDDVMFEEVEEGVDWGSVMVEAWRIRRLLAWVVGGLDGEGV